MRKSLARYKQYGECAVLSNDVIEIAASLEFGPRILRFGLKDHDNIMFEQPLDAQYLCTPEGWRVHGGLRLAFAPESEKTYWPDNVPVEYEFLDDGLVLTQACDGFLNARKRIRIGFTDRPDTVDIDFEIDNTGNSALVGAPWAITAVRPGGVLHVPFYNERLDMFPSRFISVWGTTGLDDERLAFEEKEFTVRPLPSDRYFKIGASCPEGVVRYDVAGQSFIKRFGFDEDAVYPDNNVNLEIFCCRAMMEIESLAPLSEIRPGETGLHFEQWSVSRVQIQ